MTGSQGVKRYTVEEVGIGPFKRFEMGENPYGEYVKASDYDRLAALMPREWSAEEFKEAPDGQYLAHMISWGVVRSKREWLLGPISRTTFYGPLPTPTKD